MGIPDVKRELRTRMARVRAAIPEASRVGQSESASLLAEAEVLAPLRADKEDGRLTVFVYLAFRDEPATLPLIRSCWSRGDRILVPRITGPESFALHELDGEEGVAAGSWGIPEPAEHLPQWEPDQYARIDLVIVPGLAYDLAGGRIGFGGGYYDRFMEQLGRQRREARKPMPLLAALAFREQIISGIPMEEHDFRLNLLFTSAGVIRTQ
ncbi:5-formyltetrahydrofolate cyclo-ligase [Paenibacillus sp. YPG26]|uniref:5-formyltetrahydrofolate cyclo-ligase n=1 Tax=Paenibacillus sp. YPG26 TaxID=2878915 RepID=UPI00203FE308|nr:5-formyltetrahydrofolate cyclo-ligase [Paenibacillus sp. YPG26]USB34047.1 5-formyltetrahydrofolate cyclo-ligase [Paenibacillus sp. YPG26]